MPYAPGITDRSGEILAQGISSLGNNFGDVLRFFGQQRREKDEMMGMLSDPGGQAGTDSSPAPMDLSMFGVPEGPDEGSGEGAATAEDKAKSAAAVTKAMRTLGQHAYGYDRNTLETMSTDQLRGLMRRSEYQAVQQEHQMKQAQAAAGIGHMLALTKQMNDQSAEDDATAAGAQAFYSDPNADYDTRMAAAMKALKGGKGALKLMDILGKIGRTEKYLAPGATLPAGSVGTLVGTGGPTPHFVPAVKPTKGLPMGERMTGPEGDVLVGKGEGVEPTLFAAEDLKAKKNQGDTGRGRSVFLQAAPELGRQLDALEATIIANNGNTVGTTWNPAAVAKLGQLPFQIAENYNKVVDPHSVNRPEKLKQDMEHLIPMGATIRKDVTLEAIRNLRSELSNRVRNFHSTEKELPPNLPESVKGMLHLAVDAKDAGEAARTLSAAKVYTDKTGRRFRFTGKNAKDPRDPSNWEEVQ